MFYVLAKFASLNGTSAIQWKTIVYLSFCLSFINPRPSQTCYWRLLRLNLYLSDAALSKVWPQNDKRLRPEVAIILFAVALPFS